MVDWFVSFTRSFDVHTDINLFHFKSRFLSAPPVLISVAVITVLTDLGTALQDKIAAIVTRIQGTP